MPKINSAGVPSYAGHEGVATNAVGEQFEINPSRDLEGSLAPDYQHEPVKPFDGPETGNGEPITPVEGEDERDRDRDEAETGEATEPDARERNRSPRETNEPDGSPKKTTPPAAGKQSQAMGSTKK